MNAYFRMKVRKQVYNQLLKKNQSYIHFDKDGSELELVPNESKQH